MHKQISKTSKVGQAGQTGSLVGQTRFWALNCLSCIEIKKRVTLWREKGLKIKQIEKSMDYVKKYPLNGEITQVKGKSMEQVIEEVKKLKSILDILYQCREVSLLDSDTLPYLSLVLSDIAEKPGLLLRQTGEGK